MSKTAERLKGYQTQMSIYAEQHKIILASDVLDMIEQLQDDLKDDVDAVVAEIRRSSGNGYRDIDGDYVPPLIETKDAIDIVRRWGK